MPDMYDLGDEAIPYAMQWGRGIDYALGEKFVKMYVSDLTIDMGDKGQQALQLLYQKGFEGGILPEVPAVELY